ncbi:type IV pilus twitching motility protein PilT [Candidatus Dojkabacteria bacterium]|nr:type IV pilus twitching motility protein PilT [Candidatus Dojkabacteria bacterium]
MPAEEKVTEPSSDILSIEEYAKLSMDRNASDIHFTTNYPVYFRIDGRLEKYSPKILDAAEVESLLYSLLSEDQKKQIENGKELDFMYVDPEENRFRVNIFREKGNLAGAFRSIPKKVKTINELGLPEILKEFSKISYGLVVVTGPTGSGKSTTIAAMIEEINSREPRHIITIEDPVEYVYEQKMALIAQRNMHEDTQSWNDALRAALRQDPDVVLIGEMRDYETISSALTIAETGHLVFATLHTNSAAQTIDRIIDVFPADQQNQVRTQLGNMLSGVISQRLIPLKNGGRKAAMEVLIASNAIKNAIREGKTHQIDNIIQTSLDIGMFPLEKSLVDMIRMNEIDIQTAKNFTIKPDQIDLLLK